MNGGRLLKHKPEQRIGFSANGKGKIKVKWIGTWYKPWTWFRFAKLITEFNYTSMSLVQNPPMGCELGNTVKKL